MMISVVIFILLSFLDINLFSGIFMLLFTYLIFLKGFYMVGITIMKGEMYGAFGADYISFYMVMLSLWLISLISILFYDFLLIILLMLMLLSLLLMFLSCNLIYFFIFFELSMIPIFVIIMFYGFSKERYLASMYMFIYTLLGSLPMLLLILFIIKFAGCLNMDYLNFSMFYIDGWLGFFVIFMFMIKVPMFVVHIWLPKAHVEAPVFGSMLLASIMLKMGGYGIIRCMDFIYLGLFYNDILFSLCLSGCLYLSFVCLFSVDLKILVAYSSIVHMCLMLMGFFSLNEFGYKGGILTMISHGICSSGLFYMLNEIYQLTGSRLLMFNKGLMGIYPIYVWLWFILLMNNLGAPPCFGVLGELMLITGGLMYSYISLLIFFVLVFFVTCFVMGMFSFLTGGLFLSYCGTMSLVVFFGAFMHLIPLNFFIFFVGKCF